SGDRHIQRTALKGGTIEVIKRRYGEHHPWAEGMQPGEIAEDVLFAITVADARGLRIRTIRDLEIIGATGTHKTYLIVGRDIGNQRGKQTPAAGLVMKHCAGRSLQAMICPVSIEAEV